jgi:type IX secretion system PorP/SprF family membrane protein
MKKLFSILLISSVFTAQSQDINFSQFYEMPLLRNPSLTGFYKGDIRVTGAYRSQWGSVSGVPFKTQALGGEFKFTINEYSNDYLSVGLQLTNDIAGDSKLGRTQVLPTVAFHKNLDENSDTYLSIGLMGGIVQQRFDPSKLTFDDQFVNGAYSPTNPTQQVFNNTNVTYWDAAIGMLYSSEYDNVKYYFGASYFHLNSPKVAFSQDKDIKLNRKIMVNGGLTAPLSAYDRMILYIDAFLQGGHHQAQGGVIFKHDIVQFDDDETTSISGGCFLRWNDAVIPMMKIDMHRFGIGMSYDVNISKLKAASQLRGGFEISMSYRSFLHIRNSSGDKMRCPVVF